MTRAERNYRAAAILLFLSAALHVPVLVLAYPTFLIQLIIAIGVWLLLGLGLLRGRRWVAYLAFVAMLAGTVSALGAAMSSFGTVALFYWLIVAVGVIAVAVLFGLLWGRASTPIP